MKVEIECFAKERESGPHPRYGFLKKDRLTVVKAMHVLGLVTNCDTDPEIVHAGPLEMPEDLITKVEVLTRLPGVQHVNVFFSQE